MSLKKRLISIIFGCCFILSCEKEENGNLSLLQVFVGTDKVNLEEPMSTGLPVDRSITLVFSVTLDETSALNSITLKKGANPVPIDINFVSGNTVVIYPDDALDGNTTYTIDISEQLRGTSGENFVARQVSFSTGLQEMQIVSVEIAGTDVTTGNRVTDVPLEIDMTINFSVPVDKSTLESAADLTGPEAGALEFSYSNDDKTVIITSSVPLRDLSKYEFDLSASLKGAAGESFSGFSKTLYTAPSSTPDFPVIADEDLLTLVQEQTFKYFYDFAHPASGMARERNTSGNTVTSGGSGFGIMSIIVGIERNFISRSEGIHRMNKIVAFLETADRFHGAWPHWIDGSNGKVIPFSIKDNGGDLVETSFLVQGLLTFRQYLQPSDTVGNNLINRINVLWKGVEWDWYRKNGENVLYWHWSPNYTWEMNFPMYGYFEEQITYFLAAASPTHGIPKVVYSNGYGKNGAIKTSDSFYGYTLPLGSPSPLFWVHYSYLGLDPRFSDDYADYWEQNVNASLINHAYCVANPKKFVGYSDACWGLTSSDNQSGYDAHSPANDLGVITPTAALSSFPYTPEQSMKALKFFYYTVGDRLWGPYGFYDSFNLTEGWTASSYLAIDQGPIVVMIENYRTGLLWELFMSAPEVQAAINTLNFTY